MRCQDHLSSIPPYSTDKTSLFAGNIPFTDCLIVVYDTETTGLLALDVIVQLAAACGKDESNVYITLSKDMSPEASEVTGITLLNGDMYSDGKKDITVSARDALVKFLYFLKSLGKPCILVAHNGTSLPIFKSLLPDRLKCEPKESFKQTDLVAECLDPNDILEAHNALNVVIMLQKLLHELSKGDTATVLNHTNSFAEVENRKKKNETTKENKISMVGIDISNHMKGKISNAGINLAILREAYKNGGYDALQILYLVKMFVENLVLRQRKP
ncbi:hypothetical protein QAD02_001983 [Eretmocerus hayati]|uniref:Uncharacterized protein n=1 Tax=Eretmocerus hayati TaxID=131215 RepID=A0ACC2NHW8_9HYME|nr:hypothetical protein QAD02_001983 [Eretmocerus hayati]